MKKQRLHLTVIDTRLPPGSENRERREAFTDHREYLRAVKKTVAEAGIDVSETTSTTLVLSAQESRKLNRLL